MFDCRKHHLRILAIFVIFTQSLSSDVKSQLQPENGALRDQEKVPRFHPFLMTQTISATEEDEICNEDIRIFQQGVLNQHLWAALMMDATASYPTGILHGSRYHLGNFDGCMAAAKKSPVGARYCVVRLTSDLTTFLDNVKPSNHTYYDSFGEPDEMSSREILMAVCVPRRCNEHHVQQRMQLELQLLHPTITNVSVNPDLCSDEDTATSNGVAIYWQFIMGVSALSVFATILDMKGGKFGLMRWLLCWSIPRRWKELMAPEEPIKGLSLQSLSGLRLISILVIVISHHGSHIPNMPLFNNFLHKEIYTDLLHAPLFHLYVFLWVILFISGLVLALKTQDSFFRSIFLRYLRLTPSYLTVIAFYAFVFKSIGSGPFWKAIVYRESEGCVNFWWAGLIYLNNYLGVQPNTPGCIMQSWSLSADMQLCILGTLLIIAQKKWPKYGYALFGIAFAFSLLGPFLTTLLGMRNPSWVFEPSELKNVWLIGPKWRRYISTENVALPYLTGLCTGLFLEKSARAGRTVSHRFVGMAVPLAFTAMVVLILSHVHWTYSGVDRHSVFAALFAAGALGIWSICLALLTISFALGPKTKVVSVLSGKFFIVLGRLGYSLYLIHYGAQIFNVGLMRAPIYETSFNVIISAVQEVVYVLPICLFMYLTIEAPIRELSKELFKSKSTKPDCHPQAESNNNGRIVQLNGRSEEKIHKCE